MRKRYVIFLLFWIAISNAQLKVCSWNLENLGSSKSDSTLVFIASVLRDFDVVALQEIVVNPSGAKSVAQIADELNRKGANWDYVVSEPTKGSTYKRERYAFLWKKSKVHIVGEAWLDDFYKEEIQREPFLATFSYINKEITLVNFHAITKRQQPETEIKYFKYFPTLYPNLNLVFIGDFNCPQRHTVFNPLKKMGFRPILLKQKTTLRMACKGTDCLASEYDNIFYDSQKITASQFGIIPFYKDFISLEKAREISDHVPVYTTLTIQK